LFVGKKAVGIIEAKREEEGVRLSTVEEQSEQYAQANLRLLNNDPLPFVYESTGGILALQITENQNQNQNQNQEQGKYLHFIQRNV